MIKNKILFIYPLSSGGEQSSYPIGLGYIASYLAEKQFQTKLFDRNAFVYKSQNSIPDCDKQMLEEIQSFAPEYIGITMMTTNFRDVSNICAMIKNKFTAIKIILGGVHPTFDFERTLKQIPHVDIIVRGPGEYVLEKILSGEELNSIPNLVFREKIGIAKTRFEKFLSRFSIGNNKLIQTKLEKIFRKESLKIDYKKLGYDIYWKNHKPLIDGVAIFDSPAVLVTSQGCPGHCTFCIDDRFLGGGFYHSDDFVLDEIERLKEEYGRKSFMIPERVFRGSANNTIRFCKKKIERGMEKIPYGAIFRSDFITEELVWWLKETNCIFAGIGIESGSQKILDCIRKETTVEQNFKACSLLESSEISTGGAFIYGLPTQTEEDLESNIKFFDNFKFIDSGVAQINPLPGSELFKDLSSKKLINPDDISYWDNVKYFNEPIIKLNFTEIPDERYVELFKKHASYIYNKCTENRAFLMNKIEKQKL